MDKEAYIALVQQLNQCIEAYYNQNHSMISDEAFDHLYRQLQEVEQDNPQWILSTSPTRRIGASGSIADKYIHQTVMQSLDNAYVATEVEEWFTRHQDKMTHIAWSVEQKFDGVAISLVYEYGQLVVAATRGDGEVGEVVTDNIKTLPSVPQQISALSDIPSVNIRGEIVMPWSGFQVLNAQQEAQGLPQFANPRNAASGSIRQLDTTVTASRQLAFYPYALHGPDEVLTQEHMHQRFKQWGFLTAECRLVSTYEAAEAYYQEMLAQRDTLPYAIDGVVFKCNHPHDQQVIGGHYKAPRWAIAYKFPAQSTQTRVQSIDFQVGRTGVLTPVATLQPVSLHGVTITHVSLHNISYLQEKDIRVGATVELVRSGDVIPYIKHVIIDDDFESLPHVEMPTHCPSCQHPTQLSGSGKFLCCTQSWQCPAQCEQRCLHFCSKHALNITGLGTSTVKLLLEHELINDFADIFSLNVEQIEALPGFAHKSAQQLIEEIEQRKATTLTRFLVALGIPGIGKRMAHILVSQYPDFAVIRTLSIEDLLAIEGIGEKLAEDINTYFRENDDILEKLLTTGIHWPQNTILPQKPLEGPLLGLVFVFTGTLKNGTRQQASERVQALGAEVASSVTQKVTHLVYGESAGSKLTKAKKMGLNLLDEDDFERMLDQQDQPV